MDPVKFEYDVRVVFSLPEADVDYLIARSGAHYDRTCKSAGLPGLGGFLYGMKNSVTDGVSRASFTSRELDITCKILEPHGSRQDLRDLFWDLFSALSTEYARVNGLPSGKDR